MTHVTPNTINDAFRGYLDDVSGAITAQTAIDAVDTDWSQPVDAKFHVAILATETAGADATIAPRLEYNLNSGGWNDVTASTPIQSVAATNCTTSDAASYGTTALTTGATIQATEYDTGGADGGSATLNSSSIEFTTCLLIDSGQVSPTDTIQLRLSDAGTALDADTTIPTITAIASADVDVNTNVEALTLTSQQADIALDVDISANVEALTLTALAASIDVSQDVNIEANVEALTLTAQAAAVILDVEVTAGPEALTLTPQPSDVSVDVDISAGFEALTLAAQPADIVKDVNIDAALEALTLTAQTAAISRDVNIDAVAATLTLTQRQASITTGGNTDLQASAAALTLTAQAADIVYDVNVGAAFEALTLTAQAAGVALNVDVAANPEALTLTAQAAAIDLAGSDVDVAANVVSLALTSHPAAVSGANASGGGWVPSHRRRKRRQTGVLHEEDHQSRFDRISEAVAELTQGLDEIKAEAPVKKKAKAARRVIRQLDIPAVNEAFELVDIPPLDVKPVLAAFKQFERSEIDWPAFDEIARLALAQQAERAARELEIYNLKRRKRNNELAILLLAA